MGLERQLAQVGAESVVLHGQKSQAEHVNPEQLAGHELGEWEGAWA